MPVKLSEHTNGGHIHMKLELLGRVEEIDAYIREDGWIYRTTGDADPYRRAEIIRAFHDLY